MTFDCKSHWQRCIVCNRAKPNRRGGAALQPLGIPEYPWEIVGIDYVADLPKSGIDGYTSVFIMVCHLTKMAYFVPCHKEITTEELAVFCVNHCYRLHGVPKVILFDNDWVYSMLFVRLVLNPTNYCYLKDAVYIMCFTATCNPMPRRQHH